MYTRSESVERQPNGKAEGGKSIEETKGRRRQVQRQIPATAAVTSEVPLFF